MDDIEQVFIRSKNSNKFNFALKVKTGAKNNNIDDIICIDGIYHLKLAIKAIPEDGKANIAIIDFLARIWCLPRKSITIIKGISSNYKVITLEVDNLDNIIAYYDKKNITHQIKKG